MTHNALPPKDGPVYTLAELARRSGCPQRTIRFYIARGLLPRPLKAGRGASYGPEHLERIALIRQLQQQGQTLAEIAVQLGGRTSQEALPQPSLWLTYRLGDDVMIQVRADCPPWRLRQIRSIVRQLAMLLSEKVDFPQAEETDHEHGT